MSIYIRKDHWTSSEDKIVRAAVMKYGTNQWSRVASLLVRKSAVQCKARWYEHLSPRLSQQEWTSQEDKQLLLLEKAMPNMWRSIGATLGGRTAAQCFERWTYLSNSRDDEAERQLLAESDIDESEESEANSDSERQMMAEAKARLSNNLGKKANRKQRERMDDEEAFKKSIENHRATGAAIRVKRSKFSIDYNRGIPYATLPSVSDSEQAHPAAAPLWNEATRRQHNTKRVPRKPGRPKLALPSPIPTTFVEEPPLVIAADRARLRQELAALPAPQTNNTLVTLALLARENAGSDSEANEHELTEDDAVPLLSLDEALRVYDGSSYISREARRLLEEETARIRKDHDSEATVVVNKQLYERLSSLGSKYESLQQRLREMTMASRAQMAT